MPSYRFCVAFRHPDGTLDPPLREEVITAETAPAAVLAAMRIYVDMIGTGMNSVYLLDPSGYVIWSLRLGDVWLDPDDED